MIWWVGIPVECPVGEWLVAPGTLLDFQENSKLDATVESLVSKTARLGARKRGPH